MTQHMMTVGLHDNTFRHDVGSILGKPPKCVTYARDVKTFDGPVLFVDGFAIWPDADGVDSPHKIAWLHEPPCLIPTVYHDIRHNNGRFEKVLTYSAELLGQAGSNYAFMPYGGVWVPEDDWGIWPKDRLCSMLIGSKMSTTGHRIRHEIADAVAGLPVDFYGVRGEPVGYGAAAKVQVLAPYAFSIVGECCRVDNLFTEILLDCFAVGTVPIFWGCPNVADYFDPEGILSFETPQECAGIVRELSFDLYDSMRGPIARNFELMKPYAIADDWMYEHHLRAYEN